MKSPRCIMSHCREEFRPPQVLTTNAKVMSSKENFSAPSVSSFPAKSPLAMISYCSHHCYRLTWFNLTPQKISKLFKNSSTSFYQYGVRPSCFFRTSVDIKMWLHKFRLSLLACNRWICDSRAKIKSPKSVCLPKLINVSRKSVLKLDWRDWRVLSCLLKGGVCGPKPKGCNRFMDQDRTTLELWQRALGILPWEAYVS